MDMPTMDVIRMIFLGSTLITMIARKEEMRRRMATMMLATLWLRLDPEYWKMVLQ